MIAWLRRLLFRAAPPSRPRELMLVNRRDANLMLLMQAGWRIAPEEDTNTRMGWVYLERDLPGANFVPLPVTEEDRRSRIIRGTMSVPRSLFTDEEIKEMERRGYVEKQSDKEQKP